MGQKYTTQSTSGYASNSPPDDGSQVAANLITWTGVRTKLTDVLKTFGEAINTALVSALDLSARAISTPDTAVATDHWKTLQVTGTTTITLSSAASMGAGYEVGVFNAGVGVVTVTPGAAADTINGVSASVTVSIKGTKIFRTNQALTGYNVVGGYDPQVINATTSVSGASLVATGTGGLTIGDIGGANRLKIAGGIFSLLNASDAAAPLSISTLSLSPGGLSINITKRKTADESVTSSTTLQDDDHLTFAIAANEEWTVSYEITGGTATNLTGCKLAITAPSGAILRATGSAIGDGGTTFQAGTGTTSGTAFLTATAVGASMAYIKVKLWVLNGATPGNITLQWAQGTSNGSALTFFKGSFMQATRVA